MAKKITIDLEAGTASFINNMDKAGDSVHRMGEKAQESGGMLGKFAEGLGIGTGIEAFHMGVELIEAGIDRVKEAFEQVGEIGRNALKLGVGAEEMSRFQHAANATHTDVGALSAGMDHLNRTIGQIAEGDAGAGKASAALAKLGLDAEKLKDQSPDETFKQVAEALSHVGSTYERSAIAQELFGKGGRELIPLMSNLNELMKESDDIGFTRTADQIKKAEEEERKLAATADTFHGILMDLANDPWAEKLINEARRAAAVIRTTLMEGIGGHGIEINDANSQLTHLAELRDQLKDAHKESDVANGGGDVDKKVAAMQKLSDLQREYADRDAKLRKDEQDAGSAIVLPKDVVDEQEHLAETYKRVLEHLKGVKTAADAAGKAQVAAAEAARAAAEKMHDDAVKRNAQNAKSVGDELARLHKELDEKKFGKDVAGAEDLTAKGATAKQLEDYKKTNDELTKLEKHQKDVTKAGQLWESSRTEAEKYSDTIKEINQLKEEHAFSKDDAENEKEAAAAAAKAKAEFEKGGGDEDKPDKTKEASLIERKFDFRMPVTGKGDDAPKTIANSLAREESQRLQSYRAQNESLATQKELLSVERAMHPDVHVAAAAVTPTAKPSQPNQTPAVTPGRPDRSIAQAGAAATVPPAAKPPRDHVPAAATHQPVARDHAASKGGKASDAPNLLLEIYRQELYMRQEAYRYYQAQNQNQAGTQPAVVFDDPS